MAIKSKIRAAGTRLHIHKDLYHVVSKFTDNGQQHVVLKNWFKHKKRWNYVIFSQEILGVVYDVNIEKLAVPNGI